MQSTATVTFLFSDIEGSTQRLADLGVDRYGALLREQRDLLQQAFARHSGRVFGGAGDALFVAFDSARGAVDAAVDAQCAMSEHAWPDRQPLRVRMALHTCEATADADDYVGLGVHRASRICDAGHGGQILLSQTTQALIAESGHLALRDLGEHALKSLPERQRIYQVVDPALQADFPALRTASAQRPMLAVPQTPTLGRERELREICAALREPRVRLLTLIGPGGTGKTRLAAQVAVDTTDDYRDGACLVSLANIGDPALVVAAIAQTLGVSAAAGQSLLAFLSGKAMLIVLDNFEQVIAAAPEVAALVAGASGVKFLITSREPLRLMGEQIYPVSPLALPDGRRLPSVASLGRCASVALFVDRAKAAQPSFVLDDANVAAVAEICRRLDGLPLAIELAAARVRLLSPQAIVKRLPKRMTLLASGARDAPLRQQAIRNAIAWSYDLLDSAERELFAGLAVFAGEFSIESAELVCETSFGAIGSLVDKSLLRRQDERFAMLETIREFAIEKLDASEFGEPLRDRHAAQFEELVDDACMQRQADEKLALDRLEVEHDNLRAALEWLRANAPARFVCLAADLGWFWHLHSHFAEGRAYLALALTMTPDADELRARLLASAGELAAWSGDLPGARAAIDEAVAIWRRDGRERDASAALIELGWGCFFGGDDPAARECMEQSLRGARAVGDRALADRARIGLLQMLVGLGELDEVETMAAAALADAERARDLRSAHFAHRFLADCPLIRGDATLAAPRYRRALELAIALGDRSETAIEIQGVAMAAAGMFRPVRALTLGGAAAAELDRLGIDMSGIRFWNALLERYFAMARAALGDAAADAAWQAGRRMSFDDAVVEARDADATTPSGVSSATTP